MWECESKLSGKAGEESFIYKCIQSIPAWGHTVALPLKGGLEGVPDGNSPGLEGGSPEG